MPPAARRPPDPLVSLGEAALMLGVTVRTLRRWNRADRLPFVHVGPNGLVRVSRADVERLIERQ